MATPHIARINKKSLSELAPDFPRDLDSTDSSSSCILLFCTPQELSTEGKTAIYSLFDANIRPYAQGSSMEYNEREKREELFDITTRFVIAVGRPKEEEGAEESRSSDSNVNVNKRNLLGFCSFRFDTEETMTERMAEVLYCYEVQVAERARGRGLGREFMQVMEKIGAEQGMEKVMLTCLASNTKALSFYARMGYLPDEIDPIRVTSEQSGDEVENGVESGEDSEEEEEEEYDYRILSKPLARA